MSTTAPESQSPDRRRLLILLAVLGGLVLLAAVYFLFLAGGGEEDAGSAEPLPSPVASETAQPDTVDEEEPEIVVLGTSNRDPFAPVVEEEKDTTTTTSTSKSTSEKKSTSSSTTTTKKTTDVSGSSNKDSSPEPSGDDQSDAKKEKDGPVTPEVVDGETDDGDRISVKLLEVNADYAVARVNGDRTRLYVSIPAAHGVTYVAPLGADCAWVGRTDDAVRVSVCIGQTERL